MANGILDALSKHSMFSETLDTLNRDTSTGHQMKGYDFAQNFPGAVPGGVYTPTSFLGPMLSKGYQYGQQIGNALLDGPGGYTLGQAIEDAKVQSDANFQGMLGKGFNMDTYKQNLQDFNIDDVTFANSFNLGNLFGSSAIADEPMSIEDFQTQNIKTPSIAAVPSNFLNYKFEDARTRFAPLKEGILTALGLIKNNPFSGFLGKGIGTLINKGGLTGIKGGIDLIGDTGLDTFRKSTSFKDFFQRQRDKKARDRVRKRGEVKELQRRIDKGEFGGPKNGGDGFSGHGGYGSSAERGGALHG